ncbi:FecR family protein [Pseudomonas vanderleydeniana]|uniref:FecR domain-containing protein n=1 Tax=Pseudomonas vanderleydeniana TaxID=2745495 RepID=A0A9E6TTL1_9PSED|nr:FecR domain-containing protein [Pseudomonas vanderleydeniana]QXI30808.1 FecR domain-containing protein [Pseudomonas vanderleydeniana]
MTALPPSSREEEALARHREELRKRFPLPEPKPRTPRKALGAGALAVLLAGGLAWLDPAYHHESYASAVGEQRVLTLADGSRMTLDSNSRATVEWHLRSRRVELQAGRALFDVSKTVFRPFQVDAGTTQVRVLGTLFSVDRLDPAVRVTLVRGKVDVATGDGQRLQLLPGQQVETRTGQSLHSVNVDAEAAIAWKHNQLIFDRTPLAEALKQIQRYRAAPIRLDSADLANLPITGVFDSSQVEGLLTLLPSILPLSLNSDSDGTLHIRHKAAKK